MFRTFTFVSAQPWPTYGIDTMRVSVSGAAEFMTNAVRWPLDCLNLENPAGRLRAAQRNQTPQLPSGIVAENGLTGAAQSKQ